MESLIQQMTGWQDASPEDIRAYFQEVITTPAANSRRNGSQLQLLLGIDAANAFAAVLAPTNPLLIGSLVSDAGVDFALPEVRAKLEELKVAVPPFAGLCDILLGLGVETKTRWARVYGDVTLPTVDEIAAVISGIKNRIFDRKQVLLSVSSYDNQTVVSLVITPVSSDGVSDHDNAQRIVLSNGVLVGTPTEQQATAVAAIVSLVDSLKG